MAFLGGGRVVGLDIGSSTVKVVELKKTSRGIEVERFGISEVFPGGEKRGSLEEVRSRKVEAIRRALDDAGLRAKQCVTSLRGEAIIVRYIEMPEMPETELRNALRWEIEEYIPFSYDEVNVDSVILSRRAVGGAPKMQVLFVAAKKEVIHEHLDLVRAAGPSVLIIDLDSFAFLNCWEYNYQPAEKDVVALVDIGAEVTKINIYQGKTSRFARDIPIGGDTLTGAIQSRLGVEFYQAEELKKLLGAPHEEKGEAKTPDADFLEAVRGTAEKMADEEGLSDTQESLAVRSIRNVLSNLVQELKRSIQFFESQVEGISVQKVVLGGGVTKMKSLAGYLSNEFGLPCEVINPLNRILPSGRDVNLEKLESNRESLGVAIGLALRKVV